MSVSPAGLSPGIIVQFGSLLQPIRQCNQSTNIEGLFGPFSGDAVLCDPTCSQPVLVAPYPCVGTGTM